MGCEVLGLRRSVAWCAPGSRQPTAPREALPFSKASPRHERCTIHSPPRYTAALHLHPYHRQGPSFFLSFLLIDSQGIEYPLLPPILHRPAAARPLARIPELELREDAPALLATPETLRHRHHPPPSHRHHTATTAIDDHPSVISPSPPIIIRDV